MIVYKLVRKLNNGEISPLFINQKSRFKFNQWINAENHENKKFKKRIGFHCVLYPFAPHLSKKNRVWVKCEVQDFEILNKPKSQGGKWVLAQRIKILSELQN